MEELLWFLFQLVLEAFGSGILEILLEIPLSKRKERRGVPNHAPIAAALGLFVLGGALAAVLTLAVPQRILPRGGTPGTSLILSPVGAALLMLWWGALRRAAGHPTTSLATWYGGAAFAFGAALVRFAMVDGR